MKIYFAGSISGGRADAGIYKELIAYIQNFGTVLTTHVGSSTLTDKGEIDNTPKYIHDRDVNWIKKADIVIAEVTVQSLGVGYELGRLYDMDKPVLCLFRKNAGTHLSNMIKGCNKFQKKFYSDLDEAKMFIKDFFKSIK